MSQLLEILGRGITTDTVELIWQWLSTTTALEADTKSPYSQQLSVIIQLVSEKKLDSAERQLRLYLFENPSCTRGRLAAAAIYLQNNQIEKAIEELNSVYMRQPNNTMALYTLGHCYERLGKQAQAVEFYQDCLKFKNYLQLPRQRLAAIYFKNNQLEKTIHEYQQLREQYPDDISTLVTLGHLYIANHKYELAAETFNTAILMHPDNFHDADEQVEQLIRDCRLQDALDQITNLLNDQPERADLIAKYADILTMAGATADAICQYEKALRICPDFLEATIKLGTQYLQIHADHLAAQQFNRAAEINDQIVDAYVGLAIAKKLSHNVSDALATLSLAASLQQNSSLLLSETAKLQFSPGFYVENSVYDQEKPQKTLDEVISAHTSQIAVNPQNADLHYRLGILLMASAKMHEAIAAFQEALQINPTFTRAQTKLAICLYETDQKTLALEQLPNPTTLDPNTLNLHYQVAMLYCNRIKFASSLLNLERTMHENFAYADSTVNISIVLQNLGLLDRAVAMWDNLADTAQRSLNY